MRITPIYLQIYQKATNTLEDGVKLKLVHPNERRKWIVTSKYANGTKCAGILKQYWPS